MSGIVIHPRSEWTSTRPAGNGQRVKLGSYTLYVHYSETGAPHSLSEARSMIENIRRFHTGPDRGWDDIGYNYLAAEIGGKLHIFGGRGKGKIPAAQQGANSGNLAICFLGNESTQFSDVAKNGLAEFATRYHAGALAPHSLQNDTSCPGDVLRGIIPRAARKAKIRVAKKRF